MHQADPMSVQRWTSVTDVVIALNRHRVNVVWLSGLADDLILGSSENMLTEPAVFVIKFALRRFLHIEAISRQK